MHLLVEWDGENQFSIVSHSSVVRPRKDVYSAGDHVQAKFQSKVYSATVVAHSGRVILFTLESLFGILE